MAISKVKFLPSGQTYDLGASAGNITGLGDGKITVKQNGTEVGHFTTNQSSAGEIDLTDTTYGNASQTANGLMSASDKKRLDGMADGANRVTNNNQLQNGAGYQTASQVNSAISTAVGKITSFEYEVVTSLPTTGVKGKIYLVADTHSDSNDSYDEYIWIGSSYEKIGNTDVDLSGYVKTNDARLSNARPASDVSDWAKAKTKPSYTASEVGALPSNGKAQTAGTADTAKSVAWSNVSGKPSTFPPSSHNHDDRYYTESEIDTKLNGKQNSGNYVVNGIAGTDLNAVTTSGMYRVNTGVKNNPGADYGQLLVIHGDADTIAQIYFNYSGGSAWIRTGNPVGNSGGVWGSWRRIFYADEFHDNNTNTTYSISKSGSTVTLKGSDGSTSTFTDADTNTWNPLKGATTTADGSAGYAPAPAKGSANRYLRSDGTWSVPPDTNTTALGSMSGTLGVGHGGTGATDAGTARSNLGLGNLSTKSTNGSTSQFLRGDGQWVTPPNSQYGAISTTWIDQNLT